MSSEEVKVELKNEAKMELRNEAKIGKELKKNEIKFYSTSATHRDFSNMHMISLKIDGVTWPSVEHYYQAMKFDPNVAKNLKHIEDIKNANSPFYAKKLGSNRNYTLKTNWNEIRNQVMLTALRAKFDPKQNKIISKKLIDTGDAILIEESNDDYWGCGKYNSGKNTLGKLIMQVRSEIIKSKKIIN
jgi:ribA/ribD-fused uncharacterized protein